MLNNQTEAAEIYAMITNLVSLGERMSAAARRGNRAEVAQRGRYMGQALQALRSVSGRIDQEQPQITLNNFCRTAECSLLRVLTFRRDYPMKCEFELLPVLQELRMYFYYWGCVSPDKKKMKQYRKKELQELAANRYIDRAEQCGQYKYDLTIIIQGYNHLEDATKQCLKSLFEHLPGKLKYELILVNNGSSDGTKEFFERFHPTKQFDPAVNYGGQLALYRIYEGKYILFISNDVFVLHHSIRNMLRCVNSNPDISFLVPQTPNISNLQVLGITCDCSCFSAAVEQYALTNNRYDPRRHIQRARLCNPLSIQRAVDFFSSQGVLYSGIFYADKPGLSFPDDAMSILINRRGGKNVLQKDAFCYHMGQLTIKDDVAKAGESQFYNEGRRAFYKEFGVDPWGTGFCFDPNLIQALGFFKKSHINILGINSGLGDNPLQVKECYKEYLGIRDVTLYCTYWNRAAGQSMAGIADIHKTVSTARQLRNVFPGVQFDHIIMEEAFPDGSDAVPLISILQQRLTLEGTFVLKLDSSALAAAQKRYPQAKFCPGNDGIWMIGGANTSGAV